MVLYLSLSHMGFQEGVFCKLWWRKIKVSSISSRTKYDTLSIKHQSLSTKY